MLDPRQIFVPTDPVPRRSLLALTVCAYVAVLVWMGVSGPGPRIRKLPESYAVQRISPAAQLTLSASAAQPARRSRLYLSHRKAQHAAGKPEPPSEGDALGVLRENAKQATAAIVTSIKQRQIYGFSPINYQIPMRITGEFPPIAPDDVPPRFEQYVTVEVTIDVDGHVADARIVAGKVDAKIQQTLLSAVREFKYSPATRDGTPIPSQVDIVVHIPS